jgi:hypothetical protein
LLMKNPSTSPCLTNNFKLSTPRWPIQYWWHKFTIIYRTHVCSKVNWQCYSCSNVHVFCCTCNDAHLVYNSSSSARRICYTCSNMHRFYYCKAKTHHIVTKWVVESPFFMSKSNVFFNKKSKWC